MAITVDDSTVARVTDTNGGGPTSSGSFTPGNVSLLLCGVSANSDGNVPDITVEGGSLTWTGETGTEGSSGGAWVQWFWALVTTGASMTVDVTSSSSELFSFKVYIVQGHDTTDPIAQATTGTASADPTNANVYTSSVDNSRGFSVWVDWGAKGLPTSSDTEDGFHSAGNVSGMSAYKAADTATSGSTVTFNYDPPAAAPELGWAAIEIRPAAGGGGGGGAVTVDHHSVLSFPTLCRKPKRDDGRWTRGRGGLWLPERRVRRAA